MKILLEKDFPLQTKTATAIGFFDGVHLGHLPLIKNIKNSFHKSVIYTFDTKPRIEELIFTPEEKKDIFEAMGIDYYYVRKFNSEFASNSPEQFTKDLILGFNMRLLTVGFDFRFGRDAIGNIDLLKKMVKEESFELSVVSPVKYKDKKISSSDIRKYIRSGRMIEARNLLGKFYFVDGKVEEGNKFGGKIGFPTANIDSPKLLPPKGVYATITSIGNKQFASVTNVGIKPTVQVNGKLNIETYIFDFKENIYGNKIRVHFLQQIRPEIKFENIDELKKQIFIDRAKSREILLDFEVYKQWIL